MDPQTLQLLLGGGGALLSGLFGGQPELPPELQQVYAFLMKQAQAQRRFGNSAPLSTDQERMALASARGFAGNELSNQRERGYAALGPGGSPATGDFLANIGGREAGILSGIDMNALMQSLQARQQAKTNATQIASQAGSVASGPRTGGTDLIGSLGKLAYNTAYGNQRNNYGGGGSAAPLWGANAQSGGSVLADTPGMGGMTGGSYPENSNVDPWSVSDWGM